MANYSERNCGCTISLALSAPQYFEFRSFKALRKPDNTLNENGCVSKFEHLNVIDLRN